MRLLVSQRMVAGPYGDARDALEHSYVTFFERHGFTLTPVSNAAQRIESYFGDGVEGVVLTGGNDVGKRYGSDVVSPDASSQRDRVEESLLREAVARHLPVLGICRGMQFINVFFGGRLIANLEQHPAWERHRPGAVHGVDVVDAAARRELGSSFDVNSYHRQAVTEECLAPTLRAFARDSGSDIVEGLFHPALPIAAVQYHPERRSEPHQADERLIESFRRGRLYWAPGQ